MWSRSILDAPVTDLNTGEISIVVENGMTLESVALIMKEKGIITDRSDFKLAAKILNLEKRIQPGLFKLSSGMTHRDILRQLTSGGVITENITIPEGLTVRQIAGILSQKLQIDSVEFVNLCQDPEFAARLNIPTGNLEGYLYPETYNFYRQSTAAEIIKRMTDQFFEVFDVNLQKRALEIGLTVHEAVTLASIVEGEVMVEEEAPVVSAVYHNRLKRRMKLGADPTIQYIIPDGPRRLLNSDLEIDSPYNTYKYRGLPPGPINNPGGVALRAAVNPADVKYLYFVARGDGSHTFNSSVTGHLRDKKKFQSVRRSVDRKKRGKQDD